MASSKPALSAKPAKPAKASPLRTAYLVLYNVLSAAAWSVVLVRTVRAVVAGEGSWGVYGNVGAWTKWTQTAAALEVVHAVFGLVRSPILTTLMQISSRFLLVWAIVHPYPHLARQQTAYTTMLLAWSVTEVIRYAYFAVNMVGRPASAHIWLRYHTFFVLYPLGILSECRLIYAAVIPYALDHPSWGPAVLYAILAIYVPGSYFLYTHMMTQRRKVMKGLREDAKKTQ